MIAILKTSKAECDISMEKVWECAKKHDKYNRGCLAATDIHRGLKSSLTLLRKSKLFAEEGPRYHKLFSDCANKQSPKCIIPSIAGTLPSCHRSCEWRKTWVKSMC
mgnify:CR=1 FL=1|tara:strand:- start:198 stop:515 length:318 start_codon:yes stop_codon:yes gene_type:complete